MILIKIKKKIFIFFIYIKNRILNYNDLSGPIPESFGKLTKLKRL